MNNKIATSLTALIFVVISLSGIMLFFHWESGLMKSLHEILGLAFVAIVFFHVFYNWKAMKKYFKEKVFWVSFVIVVLISAGFIYNASINKVDNPKHLLIDKMLNSKITYSLKVLNVSYNDAMRKLADKGIRVFSMNQSFNDIAKKNNIKSFDIINILNEENKDERE